MTATRTDFVPRGDVTLYRAGAFVKSWTGKTAASRGAKYLLAAADYQLDDTIVIAPGAATITSNLLHNRLNWQFMPGSVPTCSSTTRGMFDDSSLGANEAVSCLISGSGEFRRSSAATTAVGTLNITNASSVVKVECDSIYYTSSGNLADIQCGAVNHLDGQLWITARRIESLGDPFGNSAAVYWENGDLHLRAQKIVNNAGVYVLWGIAGGVNLNAPTGEMYIESQDISSTYSGAQVVILDGHASARQWVVANTIYAPVEGSSGQNSSVIFQGGLGYVTAQKLRGRVLASAGFGVGPTAGSYVTAQKLSGAASGSGTKLVTGSAGTLHLNIAEYDDSTTPDYLISNAGATINVNGGTMKRTTAGGGIQTTSGTTNVNGVRLSAVSTSDLVRSGGTLNVNGGSGSGTAGAYTTSGTITYGDAGALLTSIKTVDGSGSGLDADLIRGTTPGTGGLAVLDDASTAAVLTTIGGQPVDATLTALAAYNTNGILTQTAADTFTGRTITGTASSVTVTNGDGVSGNPTISLHANNFPKRATILPGTDTIVAGGALSLVSPSSGTYYAYSSQSGAQNDERSNSFVLRAGTYTFRMLHYAISTAGIATISIDGVSQGTIDMYNGAGAANTFGTLSITVVGDGYHTLNIKMATKNASSSSYRCFAQLYDIYPSSD